VRSAILALLLVTAPISGTVPIRGVVFQNGTKVVQFLPEEVRLLDGPFRDAMLRDQLFLLSLDPDRLLHTFRVNAGLPSTAQPLGGWEAPDVELRGHSTGHYLSALSLMYAYTGDDRFKARADLIVTELAKIQEALAAHGAHAGYLSAFPEEFFDRVETRRPVWAPYYTLHKILAGLIDANQLCGNRQALDVAERLAGWVRFRTDRLTHAQQQAMLETEFGGTAEALANLSAITSKPEYLALARVFDHDRVFAPLAAGSDPLDGLHANTQIPKMIAAAREYELTGDTRYRDVAQTFWTRVATARSYANGGDSDDEHFFPVSEFAERLGSESSETCNTYNMLKLTRHLFSWAPSAALMDFYERGLYNHILASQDPASGGVIYYCPLKPGAFRTYSSATNSFWCCVGTGMENHAKYPDTIYFHDDRAVWVNLFIPSTVTWRERGITLRQETRFPEDDQIRLTVTAEQPVRMTINLRYPGWADRSATVAVNGAAVSVDGSPGSYVPIDREWRSGDQIVARFPLHLRTEALPGAPKMVAVFDGPILLAGDLGRAGLSDATRYDTTTPPLAKLPPVDVPGFVPAHADVVTQIRPAGAPLTFITSGLAQPHDVRLIPFFRASATRYTVYWQVFTPEEWTAHARETAARAEARRRIERSTIDLVDADRQASEQAHAGQGLDDHRRPWFEGRAGRESNAAPFGYTLKTGSAVRIAVITTCRGADGAPRTFDLLVNGTVIATDTLPLKPAELIDLEHAVPPSLTRGRSSLTVTYRPHPGSQTAAVYEVRTITQP
jgi:uncharacterized protein